MDDNNDIHIVFSSIYVKKTKWNEQNQLIFLYFLLTSVHIVEKVAIYKQQQCNDQKFRNWIQFEFGNNLCCAL